MKPFDRLVHWIMERERIRLRRELGDEPPWTSDPILLQYRFCNVRRMDDRVSKWLLENWYIPHKDHPRMLTAVALARFINLPSSLAPITDAIFPGKTTRWGSIASTLRNMKRPIFNSAYMVRGNDGCDKVESVIDFNVRLLSGIKIDPSSMENSWNAILPSYGMGSFMAGQIVADLRWAVSGDWEDRKTWAPMGPGSRRGMNRLKGRRVDFPVDQVRFLRELRGEIKSLKEALPRSITNRLEAIDYQNCLCEFDKYERTRLGQGRPKRIYRWE